MPKVSVGIVTYNQEAYIGPCLQGILEQGYDDLEVIVADDGSKDATVATAQRLADQARVPVRILHGQPNMGITRNVNRVLAACTGDYVALLGGDDLAYPGKLAAQVALLDARPEVSLCYHDMEVFSDDGSVPRHLRSSTRKPLEGDARTLVRQGNFIVGSSVMVRRRALPPEGLPPEVPVASDWIMNIEVARRGRVAYIPKVLGGYRRHGGSVIVQGLARDDRFRTLDLVERRYPEYRKDVRWHRADLYYREARWATDAGKSDAPSVARLARLALRMRKAWPPRDLAWLALAALQWLPSNRPAVPRHPSDP
jgi:glycosyltransferase involved in cell wall biosynthesis